MTSIPTEIGQFADIVVELNAIMVDTGLKKGDYWWGEVWHASSRETAQRGAKAD